jgi:hypothetical protein
MRAVLAPLALAAIFAAASSAGAHCRCHQARVPRCADQSAKHRITVKIDLAVVDGTAEVITQSGPYRVPVADLDGKLVLFVFTPRGVVINGFADDFVPGSATAGVMHGATASVTTGPIFAPGEYELALFVDAVPGGGLGPTRGDLAAFDNTVCDPTGVTVRVAVGCEDATVTLTNRHFIIF